MNSYWVEDEHVAEKMQHFVITVRRERAQHSEIWESERSLEDVLFGWFTRTDHVLRQWRSKDLDDQVQLLNGTTCLE